MTASFRQPAWVGEGRGWLTLFRAPPLRAVHQGRGAGAARPATGARPLARKAAKPQPKGCKKTPANALRLAAEVPPPEAKCSARREACHAPSSQSTRLPL